MAATGPATPAQAAILQPLIDQGLLPASILTDDAVMAPVSKADKGLDRGNLRRASALLDEAGWAVGDDGMRRNAKGETLKVEFLEDSPAFERVISLSLIHILQCIRDRLRPDDRQADWVG